MAQRLVCPVRPEDAEYHAQLCAVAGEIQSRILLVRGNAEAARLEGAKKTDDARARALFSLFDDIDAAEARIVQALEREAVCIDDSLLTLSLKNSRVCRRLKKTTPVLAPLQTATLCLTSSTEVCAPVGVGPSDLVLCVDQSGYFDSKTPLEHQVALSGKKREKQTASLFLLTLSDSYMERARRAGAASDCALKRALQDVPTELLCFGGTVVHSLFIMGQQFFFFVCEPVPLSKTKSVQFFVHDPRIEKISNTWTLKLSAYAIDEDEIATNWRRTSATLHVAHFRGHNLGLAAPHATLPLLLPHFYPGSLKYDKLDWQRS